MDEDGVTRISRALHDLCQPLTALQCGLEIAELTGTVEGYREAVRLALVECGRLVEAVHSMREIARAMAQAEESAEVVEAGTAR